MRKAVCTFLVVLFLSMVTFVTAQSQSVGFLNIIKVETLQKCISAGDQITSSVYLVRSGNVTEDTVLEVQAPGMSPITVTIPGGTDAYTFTFGHVAPATKGYYNVLATTRRVSDGLGDTKSGPFYVYDSCFHPKVISVSPLGQPPGQPIEITGDYFIAMPPGAGASGLEVWFINPVTNIAQVLNYYQVISWEETLIRVKIPSRLAEYAAYIIKVCRVNVCSLEGYSYTLGGYPHHTFLPSVP